MTVVLRNIHPRKFRRDTSELRKVAKCVRAFSDAKRRRPTVAHVRTLGAGRFLRGCGACAARLRRSPRVTEGIAFLENFDVRSCIGDCNCRVLDALAGEFRGCVKESDTRHIFGECNCRVLDALSGEFRGCGQESNTRHIFGECNCRALDALSGEFRGCVKESNVRFQKKSKERVGISTGK